MAERLVEDMSGEWDPTAYKDEYADDVMKVIQEKIKSGEVHALEETTEPVEKRARGEIIDLMPLLRKSIEAASAGRGSRKKSTARAAHRRSA